MDNLSEEEKIFTQKLNNYLEETIKVMGFPTIFVNTISALCGICLDSLDGDIEFCRKTVLKAFNNAVNNYQETKNELKNQSPH